MKKYEKTNNPTWCVEQIQKKIKDYKLSLYRNRKRRSQDSIRNYY